MRHGSLAHESNLFDFFHEHVQEAVSDRGEDLSPEGVLYLSNLLAERGRVPNQGDPHTTLVELQLRASQAPTSQAVTIWRELGDKALYLAGFFRRALEHRGLTTAYYAHMGAAAYGHLSSVLQAPAGMVPAGHKGIDEIFGELAHGFERCTGVLEEVRTLLQARVAQGDHAVLLDLYDEWLRTGRDDIARQLRRLGMVLEPGGSSGC